MSGDRLNLCRVGNVERSELLESFLLPNEVAALVVGEHIVDRLPARYSSVRSQIDDGEPGTRIRVWLFCQFAPWFDDGPNCWMGFEV